MATTGWLRTAELARGEHQAALKMEFEWEHNGRRGNGTIASKAFPFRVVKATEPDDLTPRHTPEDEQLVKDLFKITQDTKAAAEGPDAGRPHTTGRTASGQTHAMRGPLWKLERALPFALSFDVEIHEVGTDRVFKGNPIFVAAGQAYGGYFLPYMPGDFAKGRAPGFVPVKIVLLPSYERALTEPLVKSFFASPLTFENLHIHVMPPPKASSFGP
jgi:hypothetical protein